MTTSTLTRTIAHNLAAWDGIRTRQAAATTDTCPACGGPAHPMFLARFGHCTRCQRAAWSA